jgi:predicted transcriptional regulator
MADIQKVTISVVPLEAMKDSSIRWFHDAEAALAEGRPHPGARRVFATEELLWDAITPKRLRILKAIGGRGPMSIRHAARLVGRDVKAVHGDIQRLIEKRLIEKTNDGRIEFPFREIHLDVVLKTEQDAAA